MSSTWRVEATLTWRRFSIMAMTAAACFFLNFHRLHGHASQSIDQHVPGPGIYNFVAAPVARQALAVRHAA